MYSSMFLNYPFRPRTLTSSRLIRWRRWSSGCRCVRVCIRISNPCAHECVAIVHACLYVSLAHLWILYIMLLPCSSELPGSKTNMSSKHVIRFRPHSKSRQQQILHPANALRLLMSRPGLLTYISSYISSYISDARWLLLHTVQPMHLLSCLSQITPTTTTTITTTQACLTLTPASRFQRSATLSSKVHLPQVSALCSTPLHLYI